MLHIRTLFLASCLFLMCSFVSAETTPSTRILINPRVAIDEGVNIEIFIPRHVDNRRMRLEVDGPAFRAFEEPMAGDAAKVIYTLSWPTTLPEGVYAVILTVLRKDGALIVKKDSFCRGSGCSLEEN